MSNFQAILAIGDCVASCQFALRLMSLGVTDDESIWVQVLATSHCWRSPTSYSVPWPKWVNTCILRLGQNGYHVITWSNGPLNTWRNNNVVTTSKRRHFDVITSKWRRLDVITTSLLRNVFAGGEQFVWFLMASLYLSEFIAKMS